MIVKRLDHINIHTRDMTGTVRFYNALLGLEARTAPEKPPEERQWLYDTGNRAVIHLNLAGSDTTIPRDVVPGDPTGAIHHVAFECSDLDDMLGRLDSHGVSFQRNEIPSIRLTQLFVTDPNNVLLELNFRY